MNSTYLDRFVDAYIECALWSTNDESTESGGNPLDDNYGPSDIADATLAEMREDCRDFIISQCDDLTAAHLVKNYTAASAGHDFWLTRNRHGAGFWDRGLGDVGDRLAEAARVYGGVDLHWATTASFTDL